MAEYELWLDESGDFKNENRKRLRNQNPSLIGGILIPKNRVSEIAFDEILCSDLYHATELTNEQKKDYVLPILERFKNEFKARQVFFENAQYEDSHNNRQLYLRMMAEGLLQLLLRLNAETEMVQLNVLIARRQDVETNGSRRTISSDEYIAELNSCISKKKKEHKIILNAKTSLSFEIKIANETPQLQIADFACNTRLTRNSNAFSSVRDRIDSLYLNAYFFTLSEINSENYIKRCLTQNMISEAIYELYTTFDEINHGEYLKLIYDKMCTMSYRVLKAQLKQCSADLTSKTSLEDDYEISEELLKKINTEFVPQLLKLGTNFSDFQFSILINLADMYLREGDILACRNTLKECANAQKLMGQSLEKLLPYYQLQEKIALYEIDSFQYKNAADRMALVVKGFSSIIETVKMNHFWNPGESNYVSEYLGDALCMQIYAMMFLQRGNPKLYEEMVKLSDWAMGQYPDNEGELERHRQYRSHIELEAGNYELALQYLMQAKLYKQNKITEEELKAFWKQIHQSEVEISRQYYLMYYLLIMQRAKANHNSIADVMHSVVTEYLREDNLIAVPESEEEAQFEYPVDDLAKIKKVKTHILYHPLEIIYWKYGSYYALDGQERKAKRYFRKAISICLSYPNYLTMQITSLGIQAELLDVLEKTKYPCKIEEKMMKETFKQILNQDIDKETKDFVLKLEEEFTHKKYAKMAEEITY